MRRRSALDPPLILPPPVWTRPDPVLSFPPPPCKSRRASPSPDSLPPCGSSRPEAPSPPPRSYEARCRFPALDSTAPHRKLPRSRRRPALPGELLPACCGLHLRGRLTPPFLFPTPSSCRSVPRPSVTTVWSSPLPAAVAPRFLRRLHVAPLLRHSPTAISTPSGCAAMEML
jgi:hypothetical protein